MVKRVFDNLRAMLGMPKPVVVVWSEPPAQKRKAIRMPANHPVEYTLGGKNFKATLRDLSITGMRLELAKPLAPGTNLTIRSESVLSSGPPNVDTIQARVVWCRPAPGTSSTEAGLLHLDDQQVVERSWVGSLLRDLGLGDNPKERRKHARLAARVECRLGQEGSTGVQGVMVDLSEGGCRYVGPMSVRDGSRVRVTIGPWNNLPPLALEGRAIHSKKLEDKDWRIGVQFSAMSNQEFIRLRRYLMALVREVSPG